MSIRRLQRKEPSPRATMGRIRAGDITRGFAVAIRVGTAIISLSVLMACGQLRVLRVPPHEPEEDEPFQAGARFDGIAYEASITGVEQTDLRRLLEQTSQLISLKDRPPSSLSALRRRAEGDLDRLQSALRSEGYYAARTGYTIDEGAKPAAVKIEVSPGPLYRLADYEIVYERSPPPPQEKRVTLDEAGIKLDQPARAPAIVAAQGAVLARLARRAYPLAGILDRKTVVDHTSRTVTVTLRLDVGPATRFGPLSIQGLQDVDESYVRGVIEWSEGEPFDRDKVEASRTALSATALFSTIRITHPPEVDAKGRLPVTVTVQESKPRSVGFGLGFSSGEGFGGDIFWEHRNLLRANENLRLSMNVAEIEQALSTVFRKPYFLRRGQELVAESAAANRNTDAFDERSISGFIGLERPWRTNWRVSGGISAEYSRLKDEGGSGAFSLVGLPVKARRDNTDDLLNPSHGSRLSFVLTPYAGGGEESLYFATATVGGSAYYSIDQEKRFTLAGRTRIGTLFGAGTKQVPANKRFYAGGGGSIRGYKFQSVGPLDEDDDPIGGRSLLEFGVEGRVRVTQEVGVVPFIEGGTVFDSPLPEFDETMRWAAGLGLRYFTKIGPLRLDVAVPLNKRANVDDDFQFYISLGQAF